MPTASMRRAANGPVLALIGCGAIARRFHLPVLAALAGARERLVLVDPDLARARKLADEFDLSRVAASHTDVLDKIDGAIILTPHHLHYPIALDCISAGVAVLVEKPLSESPAQVVSLLEAAERSGAVIAVNNTRRLIPASREIRRLIRAGAVGPIRAMDFVEGDRFDWPAASGAMFGAAGSGKGVLLDIGAHVLDLACWWTGGRPSLEHYQDDAAGGSEAVAAVRLRHSECAISIRLSWLSKLRNSYVIRGDDGTIEAGIYDWGEIRLMPTDGRARAIKAKPQVRSYEELAKPLIANFLQAIAGSEPPLISAADVLPSIELIEECYGRRTRFDMPWEDNVNRIVAAHA
jgi:predicted dehydrogenase